jgi:transcriptional regulator with XRE-family HTH domain
MARGRPSGSKDAKPRVRFTTPSSSRSKMVRDLFEKLRVNRLTTIVDLADRTGYSRQCVSFYKSGRSMPNAEQIEQLGEALGYEAVWVRKNATPAQLMADLGLDVQMNVNRKENGNG